MVKYQVSGAKEDLPVAILDDHNVCVIINNFNHC